MPFPQLNNPISAELKVYQAPVLVMHDDHALPGLALVNAERLRRASMCLWLKKASITNRAGNLQSHPTWRGTATFNLGPPSMPRSSSKPDDLTVMAARREALLAELAQVDEQVKTAELAARDAGRSVLFRPSIASKSRRWTRRMHG